MNRKYKIIWSPNAYKDLQNIYSYIKYCLKEKNIANKTVQKILYSISSLNYFPERYIKLKSSKFEIRNIRKMYTYKYNIIYEVNEKFR